MGCAAGSSTWSERVHEMKPSPATLVLIGCTATACAEPQVYLHELERDIPAVVSPAACAATGVAYDAFVVAHDGVAVVVNPAVDFVACLTVDQLKRLWEPGSTGTNWSGRHDLGPRVGVARTPARPSRSKRVPDASRERSRDRRGTEPSLRPGWIDSRRGWLASCSARATRATTGDEDYDGR